MPKNNPYKVGITGGIGAGKSVIVKIFSLLGAPCYDADTRAKELMNEDANLQAEIIRLFGTDSYQNDQLNRTHIAKFAFSNPEKLNKLNELVHPAVGRDFEIWCENQTSPYILKEAALLVETGSFKLLDKLIVVTAPEDVRIARIQQRDAHRSVEDIKNILSKQLPESEKVKVADVVIKNDETTSLIQQAIDLHESLMKQAHR